MKFPTEWKNEIHVPNHQPAGVAFGSSMIMLLKVFESQSQEILDQFRRICRPITPEHDLYLFFEAKPVLSSIHVEVS